MILNCQSAILKIVLLFVLTNVSLSAQTENISLVYHQNINLANRSLMKCDYKEASAHFDNAFRHLESPFFIDYIKCILSKLEIGSTEEAKKQIVRLINEKHIPFSKLKVLVPLDGFSTVDILSFKSLCESSAKQINEGLSDELKVLWFTDQEVRKNKFTDAMTTEELRNRHINSVFKSRDSLDKINAVRFTQLVKKYGFPSENEIGVFCDDSTLWSEVYYVVGIHWVDENVEMLELLKEAMNKGLLHPSIYANVSDFLHENTNQKRGQNYMNTTVATLSDKRGLPYKPFVYYTDSLMKLVETNRSGIGLDSFEIVQRQVLKSRFCERGNFIKFDIAPYLKIEEFPGGLVRGAFQKEGKNLYYYQIALGNGVCDCDR